MTSHMQAESYQRKVDRAHPTLITMILDDSASMTIDLSGTSDPKYQWVERYSEVILKELLARSMVVSGENHSVKARYYPPFTSLKMRHSVWKLQIKAL